MTKVVYVNPINHSLVETHAVPSIETPMPAAGEKLIVAEMPYEVLDVIRNFDDGIITVTVKRIPEQDRAGFMANYAKHPQG
jgi:uncharacterized protein YlzI (FlbEa/FlbD family)